MINKTLVTCLFSINIVYASGYKIPEQSLNAIALSAAYIANSSGADTAYYNPSNMVNNSRDNELDFTLTYIHLPKVYFKTSLPYLSGDSKTEDFIIPTLHYIIPNSNENIKYGFSIVTPGGLSKRWDEPGPRSSAEEFTLKIIEANPSIGYKVNDKFSIGGGIRVIHASGKVKSTATVSRDMEGETIAFGYNLAMSYKPLENTTLSTTYRSNIDMDIEGNAKLYAGNTLLYDDGGSVKIPLPASFNLALAQKINDLTLEFVFERTFWSKYKTLDFEYDSVIANPTLEALFDVPILKNYKDTNTYRLGLTYAYSNNLNLMGGYAYDKTPVPDSSIGFELPDSDANIYSIGFKYRLNRSSSIGMAYLLSDKKDRDATVKVGNTNVPGKFSNSQATLLSFGLNYIF